MDTPATLRKRPASSPLNAEARQPPASVGSISPPRVLRSAPTPHLAYTHDMTTDQLAAQKNKDDVISIVWNNRKWICKRSVEKFGGVCSVWVPS